MSGRPSSFTQETADSICESLANGMSLRTICTADEMPAESTVYRWIADFEEFRKQYAGARERQADRYAEEIISIADTCRMGVKTTLKASGPETTEGDMVDRSRLMIDARKWYASKLAPKKYGDKLDVTVEDVTDRAALMRQAREKRLTGGDA